MHHLEYTTIAKLILRASKKVNDRRTVATSRMMQPSREAIGAATGSAIAIGAAPERCAAR